MQENESLKWVLPEEVQAWINIFYFTGWVNANCHEQSLHGPYGKGRGGEGRTLTHRPPFVSLCGGPSWYEIEKTSPYQSTTLTYNCTHIHTPISLSLSLSLVFYSTFTLSAMIPKTQEALKNEAIDRSSVTVKSQTPTIDLNVYQWTKCFYYMSACSKAPRLKKSWFREEKRWGGVERVSAERKWRVVSLSLSRCAVSVVVTGTAKWAN